KKRIRRSSHSSSSGPEAVVFASFYNASRRQPLPAGLSGRWRRQERTTPRPRPLLPAEPPGTAQPSIGFGALKPPAAAPAETPAWQLDPNLDLDVDQLDLPRRSGSDNDSDDGERGRGPEDDAEETSPIRAVEIESRFSTICQSPDIFAESPLNQTPIVVVRVRRFAKSTTRARIRLPRRLPRAFPALPTACPAASSAPPRRHHSHQPLLRRLWFHSSGLGRHHAARATGEAAGSCQVADSTRRSKRCQIFAEQLGSDASKATTETKEQQAAAATATQFAEGAAGGEETQMALRQRQPEIQRQVKNLLELGPDRSGRGPVFLLVDSLEPSEIILSMSVLRPVARVLLSQPGCEFGKSRRRSRRKLHNWKSPRLGQQFKRVRTSGTKAVSLSLPAGRHCLRLFARAPTAFVCCLASASQLWVGSEEEILPQLKSTPVRQLCWAGRFTRAVADLIAAVDNVGANAG
uniref:ANK_REP_REGION domain-containing protein n=1 Tax=Macrostomum lignano TaxID=282301 RepID=A0A1I8FJD0_9PLAT